MMMIKSNGGSGSVSDVLFENFIGHGNAYSLDIDQYWSSMSAADGNGVKLNNITFKVSLSTRVEIYDQAPAHTVYRTGKALKQTAPREALSKSCALTEPPAPTSTSKTSPCGPKQAASKRTLVEAHTVPASVSNQARHLRPTLLLLRLLLLPLRDTQPRQWRLICRRLLVLLLQSLSLRYPRRFIPARVRIRDLLEADLRGLVIFFSCHLLSYPAHIYTKETPKPIIKYLRRPLWGPSHVLKLNIAVTVILYIIAPKSTDNQHCCCKMKRSYSPRQLKSITIFTGASSERVPPCTPNPATKPKYTETQWEVLQS